VLTPNAVHQPQDAHPWCRSTAEEAEAQRLYPAEHFTGSIAETLVGGREVISRYRASQDSDPAGP
jgi:hypothetical protein